ncbi:TPA: minichromosome maintenance protein MCM, partial [Candidatus Bathyarchaeota archaeon]|nr:minichromosome maintenance protein MCM [Candidatus Bathyarchaeota archaeon]
MVKMKVEVFERFIREYYYDELVEVVQNYPERQSLVIDFKDLDRFDTELADQLLDNPDETIPLLKQAVAEVFIPAAKEIKINYRFKNLPKSREIRIRDIRSEHLGKLIAVEGIVRVRGEVRPEITKAIFECPGCGKEITIDQVGDLKPPVECECGRTRNFKLKKRVFSDVQRLLIEEPAEILVGGEAPSDIHVKLSEDLASPSAQAKIIPGNKVRIIGITRELPVRGKSLKYDIYLEANYVEPRELEWEELRITDEDIKRMKRLAKSKDVYDKLIKSIAPSIFGYEDIKEAIALQIFGAPAKRMPDGSRVRGDIHILVVGDPATGKTKMLEYVSKLVPRSRYVSGKGVSGVGLCVAPGSFVQLSDGSVREIRELVEEQFGFSKPEKVEVGVFRVKNKEGIK